MNSCQEQCSTLVEKTMEGCGHTSRIRCDQASVQANCTQACDKILPCGHKCTKHCNQACEPCWETVQADSVCKHPGKLTVMCCEKAYKYPTKCIKPCKTVLECGHLCSKTCGECMGGKVHGDCTQKCERSLICGHICKFGCAEQCPPCQEQCPNSCVHSKCQLKCFKSCGACKEKCTWKCEHKECTKLCHEPCDRGPCNEPCLKTIQKCGHPCIGLCGEECPNLCRICDKDTVTKVFFGEEDDPEARFIQLVDCKHLIEYKAMDYWLESRYGRQR